MSDDRRQDPLSKARNWVAFIAALLAIAATTYGAARLGVEAAVKSEIDRQIEVDSSPLNRQIYAVIHRHEVEICEPRWEEIRRRLRDIERSQAQVEAKLDIIVATMQNGG